jgi:hypothetical protein
VDLRREVIRTIGEDSFIAVYYADKPQAPPVPLPFWKKGSGGSHFAYLHELGPKDAAAARQIIAHSTVATND